MKITIPKEFMGYPVEGAMERALKENNKAEQSKPSVQAQNLEGFIYVPSIKLYVAKERSLQHQTWYQCHEELAKHNSRMPTIPEFIEFANYLKNGYQNRKEADAILDEIFTARDPWRAEWLDAYFEKQGKDMYVLTKNKTQKEKIEDYLQKDKTPGIDLDNWLSNPTKHGLPRENIKEGKLYYWSPENGRVARFVADSDWAGLDCYGVPDYSYASLGVRACREAAVAK